jgi:hypothetical protein
VVVIVGKQEMFCPVGTEKELHQTNPGKNG